MQRHLDWLHVLVCVFALPIYSVSSSKSIRGWELAGRPPSGAFISVLLALEPRNQLELDTLFWQVSDPDSPQYLQYLTLAEVADRFGRTQEELQQLTRTLEAEFDAIVESVTLQRDFVRLSLPVLKAEQLLGVSLCRFVRVQEQQERKVLFRVCNVTKGRRFTLPTSIAPLVADVGGVRDFPLDIQSKATRSSPTAAPIKLIPPKEARKMYNMSVDLIATKSHGRHMIWGSKSGKYELSNLNQYFKDYFPLGSNYSKIQNIGNLGNKSTAEDNLDVQLIMSFGSGVQTSHYTKGSFLDVAEWCANQNNPPWVVSFSYGQKSENKATDTAFQKAGLRGTTFVAASGDWGPDCVDNKFAPFFPGVAQYALSVGGGDVKTGSLEAWDNSGGGFSWINKRMSYQDAVVEKYFKTAKSLPAQKYWNRDGRAFPDVSALSAWNMVVLEGKPHSGGGTSASTPTWGGLISLMNNMRAGKGKKPLGFVNPLFYKISQNHPDVFLDVVSGENPGKACGGKGFTAVKGWDPATGLGFPNWGNLLPHVLAA